MQIICKISHKLIKEPHSLVTGNAKRLLCRNSSAAELPLAAGYQPQQLETGNSQQNVPKSPDAAGKRCTRGTFRMILPPPNVTGNLHLGHALMATLQDVICRHQRQIGYNVVWVPGTDHAGIATQVVVEKKLLKECGLSRTQLGRKSFVQEVIKWKQEKSGGIVEDLLKLGCTLNWNKEYFTMDDQRAHAVNVAFIELFEKGLIKRQKSLVNWSCALESAISDIEVDTLELKGPTELFVPGYEKNVLFGRLYDISYRICNSDEEVIVSTTRPETILGDVAVAVHPADERYRKFRNMEQVKLWHPFRKEPIPLIFDFAVKCDFGSGAVKITPAHDRSDFEIAARHLLEPIEVFNSQGKVLAAFDKFAHLPRFEARERILQQLAEMRLLREVRDHSMNLPICSRSKDVIEYMLVAQWFLHCQSMADAAIAEVRSGRLQIMPPNFETEWFRWLENCHDWCISRQLWWGHQIPAYLARDDAGNECWVAAVSKAEALRKATAQLDDTKLSIEQDPHVLDTWFSSSLLPFSAFNWPASEYKQHYPLDLLETGHDILFFWVARMVMLGLQLTGQAPFKKVLLNGIVCDASGRKMSKSLGNVITPQQVVQGATLKSLQKELQLSHDSGILSAKEFQKSLKEVQKMFPQGIQTCGTDALRFTLCSHNIKSHFINFDVSECHANKLFLNKIWQATRYTLGAAQQLQLPLHEIESMTNVTLGMWDRWILSRMSDALKQCAQSYDNYDFHVATAALKQFLYTNFCDVYLETTKSNINAGNTEAYLHCATLATCLSWSLQAISPFTPFIAAELLQHLPLHVELNLSKYRDLTLEQQIMDVLDICHSIRQLKSRHKISKKHDPRVHLYAQTVAAYDALQPHLPQMQALTLTNAVSLHMKDGQLHAKERLGLYSTAGSMCAFALTTNGIYQQTAETQANSSHNINQKKLQKLQADLERYRLRVENEGFRKSASEDVQRKHCEKIKQLEVEIANIKVLVS